MLLDPSQVVGYVCVDSGLVAVTTAGAPADNTSQGEPLLCSPFSTYQRTPGVTLGGGQASSSLLFCGGQVGLKYQPGPQG